MFDIKTLFRYLLHINHPCQYFNILLTLISHVSINHFKQDSRLSGVVLGLVGRKTYLNCNSHSKLHYDDMS